MENLSDCDLLKLKLLSREGYNQRDVIDEGLETMRLKYMTSQILLNY